MKRLYWGGRLFPIKTDTIRVPEIYLGLIREHNTLPVINRPVGIGLSLSVSRLHVFLAEIRFLDFLVRA